MLEKFIATALYAWVLPFTCILCKKPADRQQDLCRACLDELPIIAQKCPRCAQELSGASDNPLCGACLAHPPPFAASFALFAYKAPITSLILALKFHHHLAYARILGELMTEKIIREWYHGRSLPHLIMPIPLHRERLKERGFNQALEIARPIAKKLHILIDPFSAIRVKKTLAQMQLPAAKRKHNVKNAFVVQANLQGKTVAVLDDVMTTGATIAEFSHTLLQQGAARVEVWCCARA